MSELQRVVALAELLREQTARVKMLKDELEQEQAALRRTETEDLPELMRELGLSSLALSDGTTVKVVEEVSCSIAERNRNDAHAWLIEHGFGGLIKTAVTVEFGRGERENAELFAHSIEDHHPTVVEQVHASTLKAFVKEQLGQGVALPFDLFGIFPYSKAIIEKKGAKK